MSEQVAYPRAMAQVTRLSDRVWLAGVILFFGGLLGWALFPRWISCGVASPTAQCLSNLKNIGTAAAIYAADNDEQVPVSIGRTAEPILIDLAMPTYESLFAPYLNSRSSLFLCPTDQQSTAIGHSWYETSLSSYLFLPDVGQLQGFGLARDAAKTVFARDVEAVHESASGATSNALYYDGHATVLNQSKSTASL